MRRSAWRRAAYRIGAALVIAIVLQLASAQSAHAGDVHVWGNINASDTLRCLPPSLCFATFNNQGVTDARC